MRIDRIDDRDQKLLREIAARPDGHFQLARRCCIGVGALRMKLGKLARLGLLVAGDVPAITPAGQRALEAMARIDLPAWERLWDKFRRENNL